MGSDMESDQSEDMDAVLSSMWPEEMNEARRQFNVERPGADQDMLEEVTIFKGPNIVDCKRLMELTNYSDKGNGQLAKLVKNWEFKQANVVGLLNEELDHLSKQKQEVELKKLEILDEHRFEKDGYGGDKLPIAVDAEYDSIVHWKQQALHLEKLLEAILQREHILTEKLQECIEKLEGQSTPVEELSQLLERADNFLHFVLQNAPVLIGHQDKELRYRFIFNHFPSLGEQVITVIVQPIGYHRQNGRRDLSGAGVKESQDFKREVLERGLPAKREITFESELFGSKTFLIYVEPVFSKAGKTIGVNFIGMEVTDQVIKREKMAKLREEIAVQRAKETELNKTIHITEETMRAKMLATMSREIRSPLTGVVSIAEILSTTKLDKEQGQLLKVMLSSGDLVLQLINDILDLSKDESGVMKLEATKFRPREVVKQVLQTSAASLQKLLTLEGNIEDDVPIEVIGDVLRIRQILTNLVSNAIKFTHEGKVGINLYVVPEPSNITKQDSQNVSQDQSTVRKDLPMIKSNGDGIGCGLANKSASCEEAKLNDTSCGSVQNGDPMDEEKEIRTKPEERVVWIRCDVYDTGIGIPDDAIPTLFKKYMQVGTGLGLATICKQLVELMGGYLTVSSVENHGSTFTFMLPYKVSDSSEDTGKLSDTDHHDVLGDDGNGDDLRAGVFVFQPRTLVKAPNL